MFEGPEKKVEMSFLADTGSLREAGDLFWHSVVEASCAQVLSKIENDHCTAYLLSESSLFVFESHLVMITCGQTRLVNAVEKILQRWSVDQLETFLYERKNELFPHDQPSSFREDVCRLRQMMPGQAYRFGEEDEHHLWLFHLNREYDPAASDVTLEILMHGLQGEAQKWFAKSDVDRKSFVQETGIYEILPDFKVDDFFFEPEGYSLNAIKGNDYYTIHVTPQEIGSYVSFETNCDCRGQVKELSERVLKIFQPRNFDVILFQKDSLSSLDLEGYQKSREVIKNLSCGYNVSFANYFEPQKVQQEAFELIL